MFFLDPSLFPQQPKFSFDFTKAKLVKVFAVNKDSGSWFDALNAVLPNFEITTVERVAGFLSQTGHESNEYTRLSENLNYKDAKRVAEVIFKYDFDLNKNKIIDVGELALAQTYTGKPEQLANFVYKNQNGNGDEKSGDGWKFRGRGILQLTGRANYALCSQELFGDDRLIKNPDVVAQKEGALQTACWFWKKNNLNSFCDKKDVLTLTKRINGGTIGLDHRTQLWNLALTNLK